MLKLRHTDGTEYDVVGHITFENEGVGQTNYTIVIDGETTTIESTSTDWEVTEVADTVDDAEDVEIAARSLWLSQWQQYLKAKKAIDALIEADITPSEAEMTAFNALKQWVADNRKIEYVAYM